MKRAGGLSTTAIVKIQVTDFNDNAPIFYPLEYNVSLREASVGYLRETAVVSVVAADLDSDRFGSTGIYPKLYLQISAFFWSTEF